MKLIIGLGNPGDKYNKTRHNLGFSVLDEYAKKHLGPEITWEQENKFKSEIIKLIQDDGEQLILVKPQTFMNQSGIAVSLVKEYFKVPLEDVIIVYDELDLPLGKIKVRLGGSGAGHHGIESIIEVLGDDKFVRVRCGIGDLKTQSAEHHSQHVSVEKFVLEPFRSDEKSKVKHMLKQALEAMDLILKEGFQKAQNQFN